MWIRSKLDIRWRDLLSGLAACLRVDASNASKVVADKWGRPNCLVTLSVRSGFDLLLRALELPRGSEVVFTAVTVPGMLEIAKHHGLVPVPVDIDRHGNVCPHSLRSAINDRTRIVVVAHLFGGRVPLSNIRQAIADRDILLVEDCAQSFATKRTVGERPGDVVMHSFGPIKTATALGGGIIDVQSPHLTKRMRTILDSDPVQTRTAFCRRIVRFSLIKLLTQRFVSYCLFAILRWRKIDPDRVLNQIACGFAAGDLISQVRHRPSAPQMRLLASRLSKYDFRRVSTRQARGRSLDSLLGLEQPEAQTYWAYPIFVQQRERVCEELRRKGFDATFATRMTIVTQAGAGQLPKTDRWWSQVLYLPWYAEISDKAIRQMSDLVRPYLIDEDQPGEQSASPERNVMAGV